MAIGPAPPGEEGCDTDSGSSDPDLELKCRKSSSCGSFRVGEQANAFDGAHGSLARPATRLTPRRAADGIARRTTVARHAAGAEPASRHSV
jgi:hypothetical protein